MLITGLRNLFVKKEGHITDEGGKESDEEDDEREGEEEEEENDEEHNSIIQQHYVFVSFDNSDISLAEEIEGQFEDNNIRCILR